jgi:hypothetical protein
MIKIELFSGFEKMVEISCFYQKWDPENSIQIVAL